MSSIDCYKHLHLGYIQCPSEHDFVAGNKTRNIAIYELLEDVPADETNFDGNSGDIIVGGGKGEAQAFRISNPLGFQFFTLPEEEFLNLEFDSTNEVFKAFWTPTMSYIFCEGFTKLGWTPRIGIEQWLAENICRLLIGVCDNFSRYVTTKEGLSTSLTFIPLNESDKIHN